MGIPVKSLREISDEAIRVLVRELGAADAARFIGQFTAGYGDYTEERKVIFKDLSLNEAIREIQSEKVATCDEA
jgi:hypothetical protein